MTLFPCEDWGKWGWVKLLTFSETMQGHWACVLVSSLLTWFCFVAGLKDDDLYRELWKLCAGPLVDVPRNGDRVFYFPQGHMEQVCICIWFFFSLFLCFDFVAIFGVVIVFLSLLYLHTKTLRPSGLFFFFLLLLLLLLLLCSCKHLRIRNWTRKFPISISRPRFFAVLWTFSCWYCCFVPLCCCFSLFPFVGEVTVHV